MAKSTIPIFPKARLGLNAYLVVPKHMQPIEIQQASRIFKLPKRNLPSTGLENFPKLMYTSGWSSQEATWRWAIASRANLSIYCNQKCRSEVGDKELRFDLKSFGEPREIHVSVGRQSIWSGVVNTGLISVTIPISLLTLTQNQIEIRSSGKLISPGGGDNRRISFGVENASIK